MEIKKGSFTRRNLFRLSSCFLLFALLTNLTYIPCYAYIRRLTRDNALTQYRQKLENGVNALATAVQALGYMDTIFFKESHYSALGYQPDSLTDTELNTLRKVVQTYLSPYEFLAEAGLSMGEDILFTRRRLYHSREELRAENYFSCQGMTTAEFVRQFSGTVCVLPAGTFFSSDYRAYEGFTVAWRWSRLSSAYFFATFPLAKVYGLMAEPGVLEAGGIAISQGGRMIASQNFQAEAASAEDEILSYYFESLGLTVQIRVPNAYIEESLAQLRRLAVVFFSIMVAATAIWIVVCTLGAARPVNRVMESLANSQFIKGEMGGGKSTAVELARSIDALDSRIASYEDIITAQRERARVQTLERALYRGLYSEEETEAFRTAYPCFPERWRMALIQYAPEENAVDTPGLTFLFTEFLHQHLSHATLLPTEPDALLVILSCAEGEDPKAALEALRADTERRCGLLFSFVLSSVHEGPQQLAAAYQQLEYECSSALEMGVTPRREKMPLSLQQLQTIYMALSCGDAAVSLATLAECARAIRETPDFILSKCAYRMIANMLVTVRLEAACDLADATIPSFSQDNIYGLFEEELPRCFQRICDRVSEQRRSLAQDLMDSIFSYIDENLGNPMLCVSAITDRFKISAPTLQKRLHAAVGQTFSAYVENARMSKARRELIETTRTVQEISEDCGYATPNSFYKAYKRRFGEAPLELRKNPKE